MMRCKNCGRTVWERISGLPGRENEGTGLYIHHHNGLDLCFPYLRAEVDTDLPHEEFRVPEPEPETIAQ